MNKSTSYSNKIVYFLLGCIILISGIIRFYDISNSPVSLYWDEVATGYNAYSISQTLKDEYGNFLPLLFRSYDDYKMPLNVYLTALSVKVFGLNEWAVRFPSAFFGTFTVLCVFFLTKELFSLGSRDTNKDVIGLLCAFLLAISPWHIQFSRAGFEANIALFFIILGMFLLLRSLREKKPPLFIFSILSFVLAAHGYRSTLLFIPVVFTGVLVLWKKFVSYKTLVLGIILFLILTTPLLLQLFGKGGTRFEQTSIKVKVNEEMMKNTGVNRKFLYGTIFLQNYFVNFSPSFLFLSGDPNGRHSPRGMGMMYLWEIPFLLLGFYFILRRTTKRFVLFIIIWLFAAPIPAALSIPSPHALRTLNILPIPQLIVACGIYCVYILLSKKIRPLFFVVLSIIIIAYFAQYVSLYIRSNDYLVVSDWADGYKQLVSYISLREKKYDKIIISGHYWQPYMYVLFYSKYDPIIFQKKGSTTGFGKYLFGGTSWDKAKGRDELNFVNLKEYANSKNVLVALSSEEYKDQEKNIRKIDTIKNHKGDVVFIIARVK